MKMLLVTRLWWPRTKGTYADSLVIEAMCMHRGLKTLTAWSHEGHGEQSSLPLNNYKRLPRLHELCRVLKSVLSELCLEWLLFRTLCDKQLLCQQLLT